MAESMGADLNPTGEGHGGCHQNQLGINGQKKERNPNASVPEAGTCQEKRVCSELLNHSHPEGKIYLPTHTAHPIHSSIGGGWCQKKRGIKKSFARRYFPILGTENPSLVKGWKPPSKKRGGDAREGAGRPRAREGAPPKACRGERSRHKNAKRELEEGTDKGINWETIPEDRSGKGWVVTVSL